MMKGYVIRRFDHLITKRFQKLLENVLHKMRSDDNHSKFYMNINYTVGEYDKIDLSKVHSIDFLADGFIIHSLNSLSATCIPCRSIKSLEIVEIKEGDPWK